MLRLFCVQEDTAYFADCFSISSIRFDNDEESPRSELAPMLWSRDRHTKVVKVYFETTAYKQENAYTPALLINSGSQPWLLPTDWKETSGVIMAGTPLSEFVTRIQQSGGKVYLPANIDQAVYQEIMLAGRQKDQ